MSIFKFKEFDIEQKGCAQKVGTDSMVLGAFVAHKSPKRILDIGTGNGTLALMMAQKFENSNVSGVEIQRDCSCLAQFNFNNSKFKDRLELVHADINKCKFSDKFDLIVSNPPFFENAMQPMSVNRKIARHQSSLLLIDLLDVAVTNLNLNGTIWLILPRESSEELIELAFKNGLKLSRKIKIFGKPSLHKRDVLMFVKTETNIDLSQDRFTIRTSNGEYTSEYKTKTIDFHHSRL